MRNWGKADPLTQYSNHRNLLNGETYTYFEARAGRYIKFI